MSKVDGFDPSMVLAAAAATEREARMVELRRLELAVQWCVLHPATAETGVATHNPDTTLPGVLATATGIREGNRLPSVPKFQLSASGSYEFPVSDSASAYLAASFQHVGARYTQPADQENNPRTFVHGLPFGGAPANAATTVDLELPDYQLVNLSAGVDFESGLSLSVYVNNLLDENALLSFDRERGGRARLGYTVGQPRTFGITARQSF